LEVKRNVIRFWLLWLNKSDMFTEVNLSHDNKFNTEDMITTIDDILTEKSLLSSSSTAQKELTKLITRNGSLKNLDIETISIIDKEIEENEGNEVKEPELMIDKEKESEPDPENDTEIDNKEEV